MSDLDVQILRLVAIGKIDKQIAVELYRSKRTIEKRVQNLRFYFDAGTRVELVLKALANGIITNPFEKKERVAY